MGLGVWVVAVVDQGKHDLLDEGNGLVWGFSDLVNFTIVADCNIVILFGIGHKSIIIDSLQIAGHSTPLVLLVIQILTMPNRHFFAFRQHIALFPSDDLVKKFLLNDQLESNLNTL